MSIKILAALFITVYIKCMSKGNPMTGVRLTPEDTAAFDKIAKDLDTTRSALIRQAALRWLRRYVRAMASPE